MHRTRFTAEDDAILLQQVQNHKHASGNLIYKKLEKEFPQHPWSSWRDRYVKILKPLLDLEDASAPEMELPKTSQLRRSRLKRIIQESKQPEPDADVDCAKSAKTQPNPVTVALYKTNARQVASIDTVATIRQSPAQLVMAQQTFPGEGPSANAVVFNSPPNPAAKSFMRPSGVAIASRSLPDTEGSKSRAKHVRIESSKEIAVASSSQEFDRGDPEGGYPCSYNVPGLASPRPLSKKKFVSLAESGQAQVQLSVRTPDKQGVINLPRIMDENAVIPDIRSNESPSVLAQRIRTLSSQSKKEVWTIREEASLEEAVMQHVKNGGHWQDIAFYKKHAQESKSKKHSWESTKRHFAELVQQKKVDMDDWDLGSKAPSESPLRSVSPELQPFPIKRNAVENNDYESSPVQDTDQSQDRVKNYSQPPKQGFDPPDLRARPGDAQWTAPKSLSQIEQEAEILDIQMEADSSCPVEPTWHILGSEVMFIDVFKAVMSQHTPPRDVDWLTVAQQLGLEWVLNTSGVVAKLKEYWNLNMPHCVGYFRQAQELLGDEGIFEEAEEEEISSEHSWEAMENENLPELYRTQSGPLGQDGIVANINSLNGDVDADLTEALPTNEPTSAPLPQLEEVPTSSDPFEPIPTFQQQKRPRPIDDVIPSTPGLSPFKSKATDGEPAAKNRRIMAEPETQDFQIDTSPCQQILLEINSYSPVASKPKATTTAKPSQAPAPEKTFANLGLLSSVHAASQKPQARKEQQAHVLPQGKPRKSLPLRFDSTLPSSSAPTRRALPSQFTRQKQQSQGKQPVKRNHSSHVHNVQSVVRHSNGTSRPPTSSLPQRAPTAMPKRTPAPATTQAEEDPLNAYYQHWVRMGYDGSNIRMALLTTTLSIGDVTSTVLEDLQKGNGIPRNTPGVWTKEDDTWLKRYGGLNMDYEPGSPRRQQKKEAQVLKAHGNLVRKHGMDAVNLRLDFLRDVDFFKKLHEKRD
ncbi:hypothetical protein HOO65_021090 [Ceratocystis lukuohia]|uniref:DNA-binding protein RAP1 n=1 Tax=Ceratocystis lukuohia TaxID=2019550 RepID=A0ABR4MQH9_9PEZI